MRITWNQKENRFEIDFNGDFQKELEAAKAARFKTTGAPNWIWYTNKIECIHRLQKNKPTSGLTITPEALEKYKLDKLVFDHKKEKKKQEKKGEQYVLDIPEGKMYITREDLPPMPARLPFERPVPPKERCVSCGDPVYFYELQSPLLCLWCEIQFDKEGSAKRVGCGAAPRTD